MGPWTADISRAQWKALFAAQLGWMLDAMDFVLYLMAIPTLQGVFHFGGDTAGLLATVSLVSSAIGGVAFGFVADRIGRARALSATVLIYSLCSLGSASATSLAQLLVWRTLLGFGMGGEWSAGATLVAETWPAAHRGKAIGIMQSGWALGYILAAVLIAWILPRWGWRALFVVGLAPALLAVWIRREVDEPAVWRERERGDARILFTDPKIRRHTALAIALSGAVMFAYWGLFTWLPSFLAQPVERGGAGLGLVKSAAWIVPMQIGAFLGYALFGFIADKFGRKRTFAAFLLGAAICAPAYGLLARSPGILFALGPLLGFFGHGYFSVFGALLAELFPTSVRGIGQGLTYNAGRLLSAVAPFTIGALADRYGLGTALTLTSAFFLLGILLVIPLPETRGRELHNL